MPSFLPASPFLFLFAPHYHPALAHIAPIRRQLNFRTIFNVLGPLINPARPQRMVLGVAKRELGDTFAEVLRLLGVDRALVVCGCEGLDEISIAGPTWVSLCSSCCCCMAVSGPLGHRPETWYTHAAAGFGLQLFPCRISADVRFGALRTARSRRARSTRSATLGCRCTRSRP